MISAWLSGLVVGAVAGFLVLEIPPLGLLLVVAFAVPGLISRSRIAAIGGLSTGFGAVGLALLRVANLACGLGCSAPDLTPWVVVGGGSLALGLTLSAIGLWRALSRPTPRQ